MLGSVVPLLKLHELFACTLMLPATFIMIFYNSYGKFHAKFCPCCI